MARLPPLAAAQGYAPDNLVCAGDLAAGRPTPMNMYRCFLDLGVWPAAAAVKVDDTGVGIDEGHEAGSWTVGVALSGNEAGVTPAELAAMAPAAPAALRKTATAALAAHGADYVIDTVADLGPVIDAIAARLARGERPGPAPAGRWNRPEAPAGACPLPSRDGQACPFASCLPGTRTGLPVA